MSMALCCEASIRQVDADQEARGFKLKLESLEGGVHKRSYECLGCGRNWVRAEGVDSLKDPQGVFWTPVP